MQDSVEFRLGSLDARMTNVESSLGNIATDQRSQNTKLDTLLARSSAVQEYRQHSWKTVVGAVTVIAAIVECAHQLTKFFHGG